MGLDSVELVMAVEEKFGIRIPDEEAGRIRTVGDMYECVLNKLSVSDRSSCLTQRAFHVLRRSARELFNVPRSEFRPDTKLNTVIPRHSRRDNWRSLQLAVGASNWPKLGPSWIGLVVFLTLVFGIPFASFVYGTAVLRWNAGVLALFGLSWFIAAVRMAKFILRPFETAFRPGFDTVRDLACAMAVQNPGLVGAERTTWTVGEVWMVLVSIIRRQTGVAEFTKDSRFVDDLRID